MTKKTFILVLIAGGIFLNACQKNIDIFVPDPGQINGPDTTWHSSVTPAMPVSNLKAGLLFDPSYIDSIEVTGNIASVSTPFGIQVNFPPNCCVNAAGQTITGRVQVELMLVKKKGDMIRLSKPTTYNDSLLVSAGEIFILLKKNGQAVQLAPGVKINIQYVDNPTNQLMKFFAGDETNPERFNWRPNTDSNNFINIGTQAYEIYTNHLRWINVAYVYDLNSVAKVNIVAGLAPYFTNANTVAFTVFKDFRSVAGMYGNTNTRKFSTGKLPVGKAITIVVISKQGNDYFLGYESAVTQIVAGNTIQTIPVKPIKKSLPEILTYLSTL